MNITRGFFFILLLSTFLISCENSDEFIKHDSGFEYRIITDISNGANLKKDDVIDLCLKYYTENDSLIFSSEDLPGKFRVKVFDSEKGGVFQTAISLLSIGDSAQFLISAIDFHTKTINKPLPDFFNEGEIMRFDIRIDKLVTEGELDKEYEQYIFKMESQEASLLSEYLKNENITIPPTESGLFIIPLDKGLGMKAKKGDMVVVHYQGTLVNGQIFDSSIDRGEPVKFILGQGDVIPAWEEALINMKKAEKIKLITPSKQAYGEYGYEEIIPPFATLIFEIKLIDIKTYTGNE